MSKNTAQVSGGGDAGVAGEGQTTPGEAGAASAAPSNPPANARQTGQSGPSPEVAALQRDINRLKSSFDTRLAEQERRHQAAVADYARRLQEAETRGMTDEQRQQYEASARQQHLQELQQQNVLLQQQLEEQSLRQQYAAHFVQMGVPVERLTLDGSLADLNASGWAAIQAEMTQLRGQPKTSPPAGGTAPAEPGEVKPPEVVTQGSAPPATSSWAALRQSTGMTDEEIYRAIETGALKPDIIPLPGEGAS